MGRTPIGRDDLGDAAVEIIREALETSGESMRALHRASGVKLTRLQNIMSAGAPIYIDELDALATSLGLTASGVIVAAERRIGRAATEAEIVSLFTPPSGIPLDAAAKDPGYSFEAERDQ